MNLRRYVKPRFLLLSGIALAAPAASDWIARKIAGRGYRVITGDAPPRNPSVLGVGWNEAILWTAVAGAIGGVARMASRKILSAKGYPAEK